MGRINQTIIRSVPKLIEHQKSLTDGKNKWIFRGEQFSGRIKDSLRTTLEMAFDDIDPAIRKNKLDAHKINAEKDIIREFQRKLHLYSKNLPTRYDILQWLSLMQHHGAPTRLLDWTYSFWVAIHFAVCRCSPGKKVAIWAVNATEIVRRSRAKWQEFKDTDEYKKVLQDVTSSDQLCYCDPDAVTDNVMIHAFIDRPTRTVLPSGPFRRNERLTLQQGTFLIPGDITRSFKDNLKAVGHLDDENLVRVRIINITARLKQRINRILHEMNINNAVLFPGLDGFSESLWTRTTLRMIDKTLLKDKDLILHP